MKTRHSQPGFPEPFGLYHPRYEHDACGVGFIANLRNKKSHDTINKALEILVNLTHRGACGCDEKTGDGAGILIQIPHEFMRQATSQEGFSLPDVHEYGAGIVFLPRKKEERKQCKELFERIVKEEKQVLLGWRPIPVDNSVIGDVARTAEPHSEMIFIGRGPGIKDDSHFERKLFVIRKVMENKIRESELSEKSFFYLPSLSCRTLIYKGLLLADQLEPYFYADLREESMVTGLALVHQRYSTNTFPTWDLAQPFRFLCHNGEINTVRGNTNWMQARQHLFQSDRFSDDIEKLFPIITPGASDSAVLDNALELLVHSGRTLPHAIMMMIPEAWQDHKTMSKEKKGFYEYHACVMEPWDGPASIPFTDGQCIGAVLDRNGLRPSRYTVTKDGFVVMASETGVLNIDPANVEYKGRLQPGRMLLVDMEKSRIIEDVEIKHEESIRRPFTQWVEENRVTFGHLPDARNVPATDFDTLVTRQKQFGFSQEDLKIILGPMAMKASEPLGSMGDDTPMAILSDRPRPLYDYFRQLFAQVTNPPLDAIREKLVTSLVTTLGAEQDLFQESPLHCHQFRLEQPILTNRELKKLAEIDEQNLKGTTLPIVYPVKEGGPGLEKAIEDLCESAETRIDEGCSVLVLSDRNVSREQAPIPAILAVGAVHHHLIRAGKRTRCGIVLESGEPREVHHHCVLFGYGCCAVNPYLVYETIDDMVAKGMLRDVTPVRANENYIKALGKGILKVMSKMGISTLHSYRGAQIFEALGLNEEVIDRYFTGTPSRVGGMGLEGIAEEVARRHHPAYPERIIPESTTLAVGGKYQWRRQGENHHYNPLSIAKLQQATRSNNYDTYKEYAALINEKSFSVGTLRGLFELRIDPTRSIPIEEVEPVDEILRRFKTGAMSYGSISKEAHETLAVAMNRIGGKSNSGEGGEDEDRFYPDADGRWRNSAIKQVASGRFGVTSHYLANAKELQIKMAQGAKPGEGGQLPGYKVYRWIAETRHTTPYVGLISPPPHHDIYSIEDLAQLIHDLKNSNPQARINVKLVSEVGVGTVAAGVSKGKADVVLVSGHDGGTGSSPLTSLKHAGLPWELGIAETHQTLVRNDLRDRIVVECDGQLKTGRDVAVACMLGAEEFGFSSAPLVVMGCIMMRVCHLNTCPVGIATQDPELREKFEGKPEDVITFFRFVAEELREILAELGYRSVNELVGQSDRLEMAGAIDHWKAKGLDYSKILDKPVAWEDSTLYCSKVQDHGLDKALDHELIRLARPALEDGMKVEEKIEIRNVHRTVGTMLSHEIAKRYRGDGLPDDTIVFHCSGSAGQSFCAFGSRGITMNIEGDANDYFGKGLSGAKITIRPPRESTFPAEENVLVGNVAFYGATSGEAYIRGGAGERFCVRNSGVRAVVESVGDHGCEYMTGGRAVILGPTGRNFAAGMSGGIAYVLDDSGDFAEYRLNREMVEPEPLTDNEDIAELRLMIEDHLRYTDSAVAKRVVDDWQGSLEKFVKIMPTDYKAALERLAREAEDDKTKVILETVSEGA